jgi:HK97 family phage major capsid protein
LKAVRRGGGVLRAAWINEADPKPDVTATTSSYVAIAQELAGILRISQRSIRDTNVDLLGEMQRVLRLFFGKVLDDGLLHGDGRAPNPDGISTYRAGRGAGTRDGGSGSSVYDRAG